MAVILVTLSNINVSIEYQYDQSDETLTTIVGKRFCKFLRMSDMKSYNKSDAAEMLRLYLRDRYSLETEEKVQEWLAKNPETEELEQASKEYWDSINPGEDATTFTALKRVNTIIGIHSEKMKKVRLRVFSRVAAALILLMGISGVWFYMQHSDHPGIVEISAAYGETKQVTLPDQTEVWLNAGSSLKYPSEFNHKIRSVSLSGEAFFSVTKNQSKPFVVETGSLIVKVLGTKFNLKAYPDESQIVATLQEGKIAIQPDNRQEQQLMPKEQLIYNRETSKFKVVKINSEEIPDWKNGNILFADATLGEILQTLERHFNISIEIDKSIELSNEHYTIKFEREENHVQILQILTEVVGDFSYSENNGRIVLQKK